MVQTFAEAVEIVRSTIKNGYPQVKKAYIIGSFANEMQSINSDLDVVVELDSSLGLQFISMIQDIEKAMGTSVDLLTMNQVKRLEDKFGYDILQKAKVVYERVVD